MSFINFTKSTLLSELTILLTETAAAQNEVALSYHKMRGLYFLAVVFVAADLLAHHRTTIMLGLSYSI